MKSHLINYANGLVGQYYQTEGNTKLVVWMAWAPGIPKDAPDDAKILSNGWFDLIRPDYYGLARSWWFFSSKNCIQTAYDTIQVFHQKWDVFSIYGNSEITIPHYDEIVVLGASYGWYVAAIMPKFEEKIKEVVLLYPRFGADDANMIWYPEESNEETIRQYSLQKSLYRFAEWVDPYEAMLDIEVFDSTKDPSHLQDIKVFIWHGNADTSVRSWRSQKFFDQLKDMNPNGDYHYAEYYGLWHGWTCKEATLRWRLHRRRQFENNNI